MSQDGPAAAGAARARAAELPLATYGTLRRGERNAGFLAGATYLGMGRIGGRLHEMRSGPTRAYGYPGLVAPDEGQPRVLVELYRIDARTLAAIDVLEAFDPLDETGSEYVRRAVWVTGGPVERAWAYAYAGPSSEVGVEIADGDWVAHRRRHGDPAGTETATDKM